MIESPTGNAFYLLMLSYEESEKNNGKRLAGTKILEGNDTVHDANGTAMFVRKKWNGDEDALAAISICYSFLDPIPEPGSLYVISGDHLAFVWHESKDVFTFKRLDLEEILKKGLGMCVPPLPPTNNFTYMERRSYTNVFTESWLCSSSSDSE
ncbi:hypothetical protein YC2023_053533 [Brassica napus]